MRRIPFTCKKCGNPIMYYEDFSFDRVGATEYEKMKRWYHPECLLLMPNEVAIESLKSNEGEE